MTRTTPPLATATPPTVALPLPTIFTESPQVFNTVCVIVGATDDAKVAFPLYVARSTCPPSAMNAPDHGMVATLRNALNGSAVSETTVVVSPVVRSSITTEPKGVVAHVVGQDTRTVSVAVS